MMGFYFSRLVEIYPFFLKGLWMTSKIAFISLVTCTLIGFILGIIRSGKSVILKRLVGVYVAFIRGTQGQGVIGFGIKLDIFVED